MTKPKERSETESLRGQVRNLRAEIKHLKRELGRKTKREYQFESLQEDLKEIELVKEIEPRLVNTTKCPKCNGKLKYSDLGVRTLVKCEECSFRESRKK